MSTPQLPVVVVGAGPAGLAAAAHLLERGLEPLVLETGDAAGAAVREWSHVRLRPGHRRDRRTRTGHRRQLLLT
ncbi:FAD-dependent oxidoreductase [Streptomyces sp. OZ13]|uniref:FAD-dependent oxidoreductase n=1 Tax=Streptomyces sp. OZ13 TaxID=3452210 RepID=UPI003F89B83F